MQLFSRNHHDRVSHTLLRRYLCAKIRRLLPQLRPGPRLALPGHRISEYTHRMRSKMSFSVLLVSICVCKRERYFFKKKCFHRFAGLMNGQQCYCISKFGRNGPSNSCKLACINDSHNYCGSTEAMSVYSTGQQGTDLYCKSFKF